MQFTLFWITLFFKDDLYGFGVCSIKTCGVIRSLLAIYWCDGKLLIDLFWYQVFSW